MIFRLKPTRKEFQLLCPTELGCLQELVYQIIFGTYRRVKKDSNCYCLCFYKRTQSLLHISTLVHCSGSYHSCHWYPYYFAAHFRLFLLLSDYSSIVFLP
jgi:hypothetical protein